ncbi:hypothetical protein STENM223S_00554 [Streptomyces tendae]
MLWVRADHTGSGLSLTTTPLTSASEPSLTVRSAGLPAASQYVEVESSVALAAT